MFKRVKTILHLHLHSHLDEHRHQVDAMLNKYSTDHTVKKLVTAMDSEIWYRWDSVLNQKTLVLYAENKDYQLHIFIGSKSWASCSCLGFHYNQRCVHLLKTINQIKRGVMPVTPQLSTKEN